MKCSVCGWKIEGYGIYYTTENGQEAVCCSTVMCFAVAKKEMKRRAMRETRIFSLNGQCVFSTVKGWCGQKGYPRCTDHDSAMCHHDGCQNPAVAECAEIVAGEKYCQFNHCEIHGRCPEHESLWILGLNDPMVSV